MSHPDRNSTAPAVSNEASLVLNTCPQAEIDSPVSDYELQQQVSKEQVHRLLEQAGVPHTVHLASLEPCDEALDELKKHILPSSEKAYLYCFHGSDLPELFSPSLASYPVWYLRLPVSMQHAIPQLAQSDLKSSVGYTDNPWEFASYLYFGCEGFSYYNAKDKHSDGLSFPAIEFCAGYVISDMELAVEKGCVIVVYECAGLLTLTGYPVTEETLEYLSMAEMSSSFNPARTEPWSELQARTRAVEDTGVDPAAINNGALRISKVFRPHHSSTNNAVSSTVELAQEPTNQPSVYGSWTDSAGVGQLNKIVAFVPADLQQDQRIYLRITVSPELFELAQNAECQAWVERVVLTDYPGKAFTVLVRSGTEVVLVAMRTSDIRFRQAYETWTADEHCALVIENRHNGRLLSLELSWPRDFTIDAAETDEASAEVGLPLDELPFEDYLHDDPALRNLIEHIAVSEGLSLTCGFSGAIDEVEWAIESQLRW